MKRIAVPERPTWRDQAEQVGFVWHTLGGEPYWGETAAYSLTLEEVERDLEPAAETLHALCLDLVDEACRNEALLRRLAIPETHWDFVAESWRAGRPSLYGRFDVRYDGSGPPKLYEYNADTPTSAFEAATFQWLWLEQGGAQGWLPPGADQFNSLYDKLRARFSTIFPDGGFLHFASDAEAPEDRQTVRFFEDLAQQAGLETRFVSMRGIGVNAEGRFVDEEGDLLEAAFKLYPWEDMLREPYAPQLLTAGVRWLEPAWKAILSNKGILPLLWARHPGHPNLLEAYFDDDPAAAALGEAYARKPLFSREGANVELVGLAEAGPVDDQGYGAEGFIRQALAEPPSFDGRRPVLGLWMAGQDPAGLGIREDDGPVTGNLSRFVPHLIDG